MRWTLEDSVEWRADKLKSVSLAVVVCRLDSDQEKHSSESWRGLHLSFCIPLLALPRIPSLSIFQDYTNPVCFSDPTNKYRGAFTVPHKWNNNTVWKVIIGSGWNTHEMKAITLTSAFLLFYLRSHNVWVLSACQSVSTSGSLHTSTGLSSMLWPPPTTRRCCDAQRKHACNARSPHIHQHDHSQRYPQKCFCFHDKNKLCSS